MARQRSLVGIDVGTTGVKAVTITPEGEVVARAEEEYPLSMPRPGWSEQDPEDWWRASEKALARLGVDAPRVGLSGQMHGLVCLDEHDRVLRFFIEPERRERDGGGSVFALGLYHQVHVP